MKEAVIVSAARTPAGKAPAGSLRHTRPDDMAAIVIDAALQRAPGVDRANHLFEGQASEVGDALRDLLTDYSCTTR